VVVFSTEEQLTPDDTDTGYDLYRWSAGATTRIASFAYSGFPGTRARVSRDGTRIIFSTLASLVSEDTDGGSLDVYEHSSTGTRLLSSSPEESGPTGPAYLSGATPDAGNVFFNIEQSLVSEDTDSEWDLYQRSGDTLRLVSAGASVTEDRQDNFHYTGGSDDGSRVVFQSFPTMVPQDTNLALDYYERANGQTTLITDGPDGAAGSGYGGAHSNADGSRFVFTADGAVVPGEMDTGACGDPSVGDFWNCQDVYLRSDGANSLVSTVACCEDALFKAVTPDADRIFFSTSPAEDLYEWQNGTVTQIATGVGYFSPEDNVYISDNGEHVFFRTRDQLVPEDTDFNFDLYERFGGVTTLASTGPSDAGTCCGNTFQNAALGAAADGSSVFFETSFQLVPQDTNGITDVYERRGGQTTLLSNGPSGSGGRRDALGGTPPFAIVSEDGSHVYFHSTAQLVPQDTDDDYDVYVARRADTAGYPRPKGATPMYLSLVPAAKPCTAPNRTHGPPLVFGSCNPVAPESLNLTVGVGDGNVALSKSVGFVRMRVLAGAPGGSDDSDVEIRFILTNVMNISGLTDYTGELRTQVGVRLTDRASNIPATTQDFPFAFNVQCAATADTTLGGACALTTTADAVVPGSAAEGTRAIWALDKLKVYDGGPDGDADTVGDNSLFAVQGVFVP